MCNLLTNQDLSFVFARFFQVDKACERRLFLCLFPLVQQDWQARSVRQDSSVHITGGFASARLTFVSRYCSSFLSFSHRPDRTLLIIRGGLYLRFFIGLLSQPTDCIRRAEHKARTLPATQI